LVRIDFTAQCLISPNTEKIRLAKKGKQTMSDSILQENNDGVLLLTLNRPKKKNAFDGAQWRLLAELLNAAKENDDVSVVVLTGAGANFSSGQDLTDSSGDNPEQPSYTLLEDALAAFDKPLLAAVKGVAVGGGATLLLLCDIIYVGESLRFRLPFTSLGLSPEFGSSFTLPQLVGPQRAADILFDAEFLSADQVTKLGIALDKFSDEEVLEKTLEHAQKIAQKPVNSLQATKQCMMAARNPILEQVLVTERAALKKQAGSPENIEAIMAFMEKREPDFRKLKK